MSSVPEQSRAQRDHPPPWGGRGVYASRILELMGLLDRAVDLTDLRRSPGLKHATDEELVMAMELLERAGRVRKSVAAVRFRPGETVLRRDVTVWALVERGPR